MNCPNCGAEVPEKAKFCVKCGEPLRREIEIAPIWKWGSMVASLVLIFIFWIVCILIAMEMDPITPLILMILLIFGFPATIYLMYKERTAKIKYGLAWIFFPIIIILLLYNSGLDPDDIFWRFLIAIPAIFLDFIYVSVHKV